MVFIGSESFINERDSKMLGCDFNGLFGETMQFWYSFVALWRGHHQVQLFDEGKDRNAFRNSCRSQM